MKKCKKCLLLEAGENKSYNTIKEYLDNIDPSLKTDMKNYKLRLCLPQGRRVFLFRFQ